LKDLSWPFGRGARERFGEVSRDRDRERERERERERKQNAKEGDVERKTEEGEEGRVASPRRQRSSMR
jgi:hypothetical protein